MNRSMTARLKRGGILLLPLLVCFLVGKKAYLYVSSEMEKMPGPQITDFLAGVLLITIAILTLDQVFDWISKAKLFSKKKPGGMDIPLVDVYRRIMEDKEAFPEVAYFDGGRLRKGIKMSSEYPMVVRHKEIMVFNVLEPRPASAGGRMCQMTKKEFWHTGRSGAETIAEITIGYGIR